jgi:DNA-binding transcriptional regulator YdaS (Cro superfamily)
MENTDTPLKRWRTDTKRSPQEAATLIGVTLPMWSRWERAMRDVPAVRVLDIEAKTGISRHDLRPDVFGPAPAQGEAA